MLLPPQVKQRQWIVIDSTSAFICAIYSDDKIAVVCLDGSMAFKKDVLWKNRKWHFDETASIEYADESIVLGPFVELLREGPPRKKRGALKTPPGRGGRPIRTPRSF